MPNIYEVQDIFKERAGRTATSAELLGLGPYLAPDADPALGVSAIQKAAQAARSNGASGAEAAGTESTGKTRYPTIKDLNGGNDEIDAYFRGLDITAPTEGEKNDTYAKYASQIQSTLDSIDALFAGRLAREAEQARDRSGQTRAIGARSGLLGTPRGGAQQEKTQQYNEQINRQTMAEKNALIVAAKNRAQDRADKAIELETASTKENAANYINYLKGQREDTKNDIKTIAGSGLAMNELEPDLLQKLIDQSGLNPMLFEITYNSALPKAKKIDYKIEKLSNDRILFYGQNPTTGEIESKTFDYSLPQDEELKVIDGTAYGQKTDASGNLVLRKLEGIEEKPEVKGGKETGLYYVTYEDGKPKLNYLTSPSGDGSNDENTEIINYVEAVTQIDSIPTVTQEEINAAAAQGQTLNGMTQEQKNAALRNIRAQAGDDLPSGDFTKFEGIIKTKEAEKLNPQYKITPQGVWDVESQRYLTEDEENDYYTNIVRAKI